MKNSRLAFLMIVALILGGCSSTNEPVLKGSYQSEREGTQYVVQLAFQSDDQSFVEYIDNREVDRGTYEKDKNHRYILKSERQETIITLTPENTFELVINKIHNGEPITLHKINDTPVYFSTEFDDVEEYQALLE